MKYLQVVGGPGSGKSTLARKLALKFDLGCIELDAFHWNPGWVASSYDEFVEKIQKSMEEHSAGWVIDGSYTGMVGKFVQPKLDILVYLQIPPYITVPRALRRSIARMRKGELLWGNNKETMIGSLKLAWWTLKSYRTRVKRMHELRDSDHSFEMHIFKSNKEADEWFESLERVR